MDKLVIGLKEAAEALGVCYPVVRGLAEKEDFPAFRIGEKWVVSVLGLNEWIAAQASAKSKITT